MTCSEYQKLISAYVDDMLTLQEKQELEEHLKKCPACRAEYEALVEIQKMCQSIEDVALPEGFHEDMMKKIKTCQLKTEKRAIKSIHWLKLGSYGGGLVAAAFVGVIFINMLGNMSSSSSIASEAAPSEKIKMSRSLPSEGNRINQVEEFMSGEKNSSIESFDETEDDVADTISSSESSQVEETLIKAQATVEDEKAFEKALDSFIQSYGLTYSKQGRMYEITLWGQKDDVLGWLKAHCKTFKVMSEPDDEATVIQIEVS